MLAAIIVLVAAFGLFTVLTQPNPSITISGEAGASAIPTGSPDKVFHVQGQKFSHNETITLLLDEKTAPGSPKVQSDGNGAFTVDLKITDDWVVGKHQIKARDTSGYVTKTPAQVQIVAAPVIDVVSKYESGSTPAGAAGTTFDVTGKRFPAKASVSFLLDGKPAPGVKPAQTDDLGRINTEFSVTGDWTVGSHAVTAQDDQGNTTQQSEPIVVVNPGEAGTPGPNGAPADDATFHVNISVSGTTSDGLDVSYTDTLNVNNGSVCGVYDDGQPHDFNGSLSGGGGESFVETITFSCSGSYKSGHLTYTETATSDKMVLSDGSVCISPGAYVYARLDGTFTDSGTVSGSYTSDYFQANCNSGSQYVDIYRNPATGSFTGGKY